MKLTKKQELTQQLALETAVRLGLIACLRELIVQHAKVVGGDQTKAIGDIQFALTNTISSLKVNAKDEAGGSPDISAFIQKNVQKMIDRVCKDALARSSKAVH